MTIKKILNYSDKRQIWRLLLNTENHLLIEERDVKTKAVSFSCVDLQTKKFFFKGFQFEEKFWIGIEAFAKDIVLLHKYIKPDMPQHKGLTAFKIDSKEILWHNDRYQFLFCVDDDIYCRRQKFDSKEYYVVDIYSGNIKKELGGDLIYVQSQKTNLLKNEMSDGYLFPESLHPINNEKSFNLALEASGKNVVDGFFDAIEYEGNIFVSFHAVNSSKTYNNLFYIINATSGKIIFDRVLNKNSDSKFFDSFFIKDKYLFLLKEKSGVEVCLIEL